MKEKKKKQRTKTNLERSGSKVSSSSTRAFFSEFNARFLTLAFEVDIALVAASDFGIRVPRNPKPSLLSLLALGTQTMNGTTNSFLILFSNFQIQW